MPTEKPLTGNMRADGEALDRDAYERAGGYRALRKALQSMTPEAVTEEVKILEPARPRRRGIPHGTEVDLRSKGRVRTRDTWSLMPTRWSPARSRIGCSWKAIRTS